MADDASVALVSGATGVSGRGLLEYLVSDRGAGTFSKVYAIARREIAGFKHEKVQILSMDLSSKDGVRQALSQARVQDVNYIFHCAYAPGQDEAERAQTNEAFLANLVEGVEAAGCSLKHVYCNTGMKWYGVHFMTVVKTPAEEDDPRHMPPNFYYNQQDYLDRRVAEGAKWTWSCGRPNPIIGFSTKSDMNLLTSLAVYCTVCRELDLPLRFPGNQTAWNALLDVVDARLLGEAMVFFATHKTAHNQAFNVNNGDQFRWHQMWPKIVACFGLETGPPLEMPLATVMATPDKEELWDHTIKPKYGLRYTYKELTTWTFVDFCFRQPCDWFSNLNKARKAGFHFMQVDSDVMFAQRFQELQDMKAIPPYSSVDQMAQDLAASKISEAEPE